MGKGFGFREFTISHDRCGMKVGTDSVLLGSWAKSPESHVRSILDIGTGTGILALMMAQRCPEAQVCGVEIDHDAFLQASENAGSSKFRKRIRLCLCDFRTFTSERKYDVIISNPPFFSKDSRTINVLANQEERGRYTARHTDSLPFRELVAGAKRLLSGDGFFSVIVPCDSALNLIGICAENDLYLTRRCDVRDSPDKDLKRCMMTFSHKIVQTELSLLSIHDESGAYSDEFRRLTGAFYLPAVFT